MCAAQKALHAHCAVRPCAVRDARIFGRRSVANDSAGVWVCNVRWRRAEHPRPAPPTHRPVSEFWAVASPAVLRAWAAGRGMRGVHGVRICEYANMRGARLFHAYLSAPYLPPRNVRAVYITSRGGVACRRSPSVAAASAVGNGLRTQCR